MTDETPAEKAQRLALEEVTGDIGRTIGAVVTRVAPGAGFAFLMFDFGGKGNIAYMSNAVREDMIRALTELIGKLRRQ